VRIFKNTWFTHFADKEGIADTELRETVNRHEAGQADADPGGGVFKVRVACPGEGKSGGYRIIVFFKNEALKVIHQDAEGLHRLGIISDKEMREYDQDCLIQEPETTPVAPKTEVTEQVHA